MSRLYEMVQILKTSLFPNPRFSFSKMAKDEISSARNRILENGVDCKDDDVNEDDDNFVVSCESFLILSPSTLSLQTNTNQEKDQNDEKLASSDDHQQHTQRRQIIEIGEEMLDGKLEVVIEGFDQCSIFMFFIFMNE